MALFAITALSGSGIFLGAVSLVGALFLVYLGYETFSSVEVPHLTGQTKVQPLMKGVVTNFLNPHPYLFWFTVGTPIIMKAFSGGAGQVASFIAGFYIFITGSKVFLSFLAGSAGHLLEGRAYGYCMRVLGILLWVCALVLARDGMRFFGMIR